MVFKSTHRRGSATSRQINPATAKMKSLSLAGLVLVLALSASPALAQSVPKVTSGFALAAERGHLKVPIYKDAAE